MNCVFTNNVADGKEGESKRYGGSAVYLSARKGRLKSNVFVDNIGDITVKIVNNFVDDNKDKSTSLLEVSECDFKAAKGSKNSLYYIRGNYGSKLQLKDCTFAGDLKPGSHHIDGKEIVKNSPKLMIKNCRFADDEGMTSNAISLLSDGMRTQVFNDEKSSYDIRKESLSKTWKIAMIPSVAIILVSFAIIYINRMKQNDQQDDSNLENDTFDL